MEDKVSLRVEMFCLRNGIKKAEDFCRFHKDELENFWIHHPECFEEIVNLLLRHRLSLKPRRITLSQLGVELRTNNKSVSKTKRHDRLRDIVDDLETKCQRCYGKGTIAESKGVAQLERWTNEFTRRICEGLTPEKTIEECGPRPPDPEILTCPDCEGNGYFLTEYGKNFLKFLRRYRKWLIPEEEPGKIVQADPWENDDG